MGKIMTEGNWAGFEVIHSYSRADAIADGVLIDLSSSYPQDVRMFKWPVACTDSVWSLIERAAESDGVEPAVYVWDMCYMGCLAIQAARDSGSSTLFFKVCLPLGTPEKQLKLVCGPGDDLEPVLTIMLPHED